MDVTHEQMISTAINVVGFIAASGLWMVLFARTRQRREPAIVSVSGVAAEKGQELLDSSEQAKPFTTRMEYLDLGKSSDLAVTNDQSAKMASVVSPNGSRNRIEILQMARGMLNNGSSAADIKQALPVTDGELALMNRQVGQE